MEESIQKICAYTEYRQTLAQRGPEHAIKFTWETSLKKHMALLETVLN
ncbi:MAG: hypothetical protein H8E67_02060 [Proteobacteria bacterium]|nr:hypothetical protein [Pseudomonadota bacterium]MBT5259194.1 hypothetical protein [Nitrospina sp.]MBT6952935.1 hypothetical protein [Flavobacteriaceae bacterium]MBT7522206.1 hypothetical protein [Nitrospina sp.]